MMRVGFSAAGAGSGSSRQIRVNLVQDPREAAIAMMVAVAQSDGAMTDRERQVIMAELVARVGATKSDRPKGSLLMAGG
jgi:uncharacterized membrane protein YebE (DUF533 family)